MVGLAHDRLPSKMGEIYAGVVAACLHAWMKTILNFGVPEELEDEDGVQVEVGCIEKVSIMYPSRNCMLTKSDSPSSK
jgi:hypothetical protein